MNSKRFETLCIVIIVVMIIILIIAVLYTTYKFNEIRKYRNYNESVLDSAVTYLGLEKCTIEEGTPYFTYGNEKYEVISFYKEKKQLNE